jgi:hypothetical protein
MTAEYPGIGASEGTDKDPVFSAYHLVPLYSHLPVPVGIGKALGALLGARLSNGPSNLLTPCLQTFQEMPTSFIT